MHDEVEEDLEEEKEENPELEAEFMSVLNKHHSKIEEQLKIARKAISKAEKIAEKYGIPFDADVSPLSQTYTPASFEEKFGELDKEYVCEQIGIWPGGEYDCEGWEHSAVC